jgi:thiol-disulfide isomerase/thioredoxin
MTSTGLIVAAAVLVIGTVVGLWRRRTDGRFHSVGPSRPTRTSPSAADRTSPSAADRTSPSAADRTSPSAADRSFDDGGVMIAGVTPADRDGLGGGDPSAAGVRLDPELLAALGVGPAQATLLQFSSAFCSPCRALRRISSEVAQLLPGVRHVEVDAESHLEAVRALGIWRTPTLLVLDADGRVAKRATGVPGKAQLIAALGELLKAA